MPQYEGKWKSKRYPAKMVSGTASVLRFENDDGHHVTRMEMRYGGMFAHWSPVKLDHTGPLPPKLELLHEETEVTMEFEQADDHLIRGKYTLKNSMAADNGVFHIPRDVSDSDSACSSSSSEPFC